MSLLSPTALNFNDLTSSMKNKFFNSLDQKLQHVPREFLENKVWCNACKNDFKPDLLAKIKPIIPRESSIPDMPGYLIPATTIIDCQICGNEVVFKMPVVKTGQTYHWFGDEAYREFRNMKLITYTLVGMNTLHIDKAQKALNTFKQKTFPNHDPKSWRLHVRNYWNKSDREDDKLFCNFSRLETIKFSKEMAKLIRNMGIELLIYNSSAIYHDVSEKRKSKKIQKSVRDICYSVLLMKVIDDCTRQGVIPAMHFDSDSKDGWAKQAFYGSQINLLYAILAKGVPIPEPKYVEPGSHELLEIADFVSFTIARHCYRKAINKPVEIDSRYLGDVMYIGFNAKGDMLYNYKTGYPWRFFYGNNGL